MEATGKYLFIGYNYDVKANQNWSIDLSAEPHIGIRHLQAVLLFLAIVVNYIPRLNVSVAVVAMTNAATTNPKFPVSISIRPEAVLD